MLQYFTLYTKGKIHHWHVQDYQIDEILPQKCWRKLSTRINYPELLFCLECFHPREDRNCNVEFTKHCRPETYFVVVFVIP